MPREFSLSSEAASSIAYHKETMESVSDGTCKELLTWSPKHKALIEVEEYLIKRFKELLPEQGCEYSYDVTAIESLCFKTINYTTYAGSILIHPLNFEQCLRQMSDAYGDNISLDYDHIDHIKKQTQEDGTFSKYSYTKKEECNPTKVLMVLPGGNKLKKHCCVGQMEKILDRFGRDNVTFKRHPISYYDVYDELSEYLGGIKYAPKFSDLNELIDGSEYVFTSMLSESSLNAAVKGKKIGHFDLLQNRNTTSFGHIGYYLFTTKDPVSWARRAFASPKSGLINPHVDKNWKDKIDKYLHYILELRSFYKPAYIT